MAPTRKGAKHEQYTILVCLNGGWSRLEHNPWILEILAVQSLLISDIKGGVVLLIIVKFNFTQE